MNFEVLWGYRITVNFSRSFAIFTGSIMLVKVLFEGEIIVSRDINEFIDFDVWTAKVIKDLDYVGLLF